MHGLQAIEHAVEEAVEHAITATERSLAQRFGAGCVRGVRRGVKWTLVALLIAYFAFGTLLLVTRYWVMPNIDQVRPWLERELSSATQARLTIGRIDAGWRGFNPHLTLRDLRLTSPTGDARLALPQVDAELSWGSVPRMSLHFAALSVLAPELEVRRLGPHRFSVAGFAFDVGRGNSAGQSTLLDWLLEQQRISIRDARVIYVDDAGAAPSQAATAYAFNDVQLTLLGGVTSTRLSLQARPPGELAGTIDVRGDFRHGWLKRPSDVASWKGRLFVQMDSADLARAETVARLLPASMRIERAQGALRAWVDVDHMALTQLTADVVLSDVRAITGTDLAPLQVDTLQGRFTQRKWGSATRGGQELELQNFSIHGNSLDLPSTDLRYRYTRGTPAGDDARAGSRAPRTEIEASRLSLDTLTHLAAHVPLARALQERIARQAIGGTLTALRIDLDGEPTAPDRYAVQTRFDNLSMSAQPADPLLDPAGRPRAGLPGFGNLSGSLDLTEAGGTVHVDARDATIDLPGVLTQPLTLERLDLRTRITHGDGRVDVQLQSLAAINDELDVSASGTYSRGTAANAGPGSIDLTARVNTLAVAAAPRLIPLQVGPQVRAWLAQALQGGRAGNGSVRLQGDLRHFPFRERERGEFRAQISVRDAVLDYLPAAVRDDGSTRPAWPRIERIDADVLFERQALTVSSRSARIFGTQLNNVVARVPDLFQPDSTLALRGVTGGPAADMLRYVNESGLKEPLRFLNAAGASGNARLDLKLDVPLTHARDIAVAGTVVLSQNDINLGPDIPALTQVAGRIDFTRTTVRFSEMRAGLAGGQVSANGGTRSDGAIELTGSGTAAPAAVARLVEVAPVQRLLAKSRGSTRYSAKLTLWGGRTDLQVDSDLAGWSIDAPAPLGKAATATLPLRIELKGLGGDRDQVVVDAGNALRVRLDRVRAGGRAPAHVERGVIALGESAPVPARGLLAHINLPRIDFDAWRELIDGADGAGAAASTGATVDNGIDTVNLRARELLIAGKPIANVNLRAKRVTDSGEAVWLADVESDQVQGALNWRPGQSGRLGARLTRLAIPESQRVQVTQLLDAPPTAIPGFDVIADSFELGGRNLGRLELAATNGGTAAQPVWNVDKLEIKSPEGHLNATGRWQREPGQTQRTMSMAFGLDFGNGGALLKRLGIPDALRDGQGRIEGEVNWRGSPFAIHYPTLAGNLKLNTSKGQFLKASAGAGRLLGVLSLQSLPRRMTLDFRDIFAEGFAFDSMSATALLKAGVLTTHDFRMGGASAKVLIEGSADIGRETQNLHVLVLPEINAGSASLAYALFANPAIGLGTFLAQLVLREPLSKAFSFEYDVTGSWAVPQVKRRERNVSESAAGGN